MRDCSRIQWMVLVVLVLLISTGCSLLSGKEESQPIDPPQDIQVGGNDSSLLEQVIETTTGPNINMNMYFKDPDGYVVPIKMSFPNTESPAKETLRYMIQGGPGEDMLPAGFSGLLPAGTEVLGMDVIDGLAIVDFSKEFMEYDAEDERRILEAITWTLTGYPTIDQVTLRVDGTKLKEMPVGATPLDVPLSRSMGINLEKSGQARPTASMPVTVYYQNQISGQDPYFVPVTRLVERSEDRTMALLEELIKGPAAMSGLNPVINEQVTVLHKDEKEGLVTINLSEEIAGANQVVSAEAIQTIVLSLTENLPPDTQVQILVNGQTQFTDAASQTYDQPVTRPVHVNEIPM